MLDHPHDQALTLHSLIDLMSRIARTRNPQATQINLGDLNECLRYVEPVHAEAARLIQRGLGDASGFETAGATQQELQRLLETDFPSERMPTDENLGRLLRSLARRYPEGGFLRWQSELSPQSQPLGWHSRLYGLLLAAVNAAAPGQTQAAHEIARGIAMQLQNPDRNLPARLLLSGPKNAGARQMARAISTTLQAGGYAALELEMSQIRCAEEAAELDGSKPYWKGARPGKLTAFVHQHPKAVVILHDLDRTMPAVQASLLPALSDGVLVDNYGLGERSREQREQGSGLSPTPVNMAGALLIFTSSSGHDEVWSQPDFAELLDRPDADLRDLRKTVLTAMRSAEQVHRNERSATFDIATLDHLEADLVVVRPQRWASLLAMVSTNLNKAVALASQQLRRVVTVEAASAEAIALAYVASFGGNAGLDQLSPERMLQALFTPVIDALFTASLAGGQPLERAGVELRMPATDAHQLSELLEPLGSDRLRQLQRRRISLRYDSNVAKSADGETWSIELKHPRLVQARDVSDFAGNGGETGLSAIVPQLGFADIAGHEDAKAHLREVIALYRQADLYRAKGIALPRGCVLYGPPGSGKTMLAQAFAAEAGMAFIAATGTDLLNPERVRQIFALAQKNAPSAVFIDEVDALGRRGSKSASHDAAINRLLAAVQGFDERAPIYVLAATNRPKLLDEALTRPGRLDHSIYIGKLDRGGRLPMVRKLLELLPAGLDDDGAAEERLLSFSHGLTGAALSQVLRECRLLQLRRSAGSTLLCLDDLIEQLQRQKYGAKGDAQRDPGLRERIAFHEAGHAVLHGLFFPELSIEQVSITARGDAEGFMAVNHEIAVRLDETPERVRMFMAVLLGGRLAEQHRYGPEQGPSSGSAGDFARAREAAFKAVAHHGLDTDWGLLSLAGMDEEDRALLPEQIKTDLWARIRAWLLAAQELAHLTLHRHWAAVEQLAAELLAQDYVSGTRVRELLTNATRTKAQLQAA